ncbi:hypothetical protein DFJ73DRAFT_758132 [Zopfochytrium polystomum]|nr:hypothetical protein DFJ73DRAFT_758132 [Zopfochytrium polystomum]
MWYYEMARSQTLEACDSPTVENLQALCPSRDYKLEWPVAWYLFPPNEIQPIDTSYARRFIFDWMSTPDDISQEMTAVEKETRRRCWWSCYLFDRYVSVNSLRPSSIRKKSWPVKLLCPELMWESVDPAVSPTFSPVPRQNHYFGAFIDVLEIFLESLTTTNATAKKTPSPTYDPDHEAVAQLRLVWSRLEAWRATLSPSLWINIDEFEKWLPTIIEDETIPWRWMILQFCIYHITILNVALSSLLRNLPLIAASFERSREGGGFEHSERTFRAVSPSFRVLLDAGVAAAIPIAKMGKVLNKNKALCLPFSILTFVTAAAVLSLAEPTVLLLPPDLTPFIGLCGAHYSSKSEHLRPTTIRKYLADLTELFGAQRFLHPIFAGPYESFRRLAASDWAYFDQTAAALAARTAAAAAADALNRLRLHEDRDYGASYGDSNDGDYKLVKGEDGESAEGGEKNAKDADGVDSGDETDSEPDAETIYAFGSRNWSAFDVGSHKAVVAPVRAARAALARLQPSQTASSLPSGTLFTAFVDPVGTSTPLAGHPQTWIDRAAEQSTPSQALLQTLQIPKPSPASPPHHLLPAPADPLPSADSTYRLSLALSSGAAAASSSSGLSLNLLSPSVPSMPAHIVDAWTKWFDEVTSSTDAFMDGDGFDTFDV